MADKVRSRAIKLNEQLDRKDAPKLTMREWSVAAFPPKPDLPESGSHISRLPIRLLYHDAGQRICPQVVAMQLCPLAVEKFQRNGSSRQARGLVGPRPILNCAVVQRAAHWN